jgi:transcriptional regulator with XRE-family HTH domain
MKNDCPTCGYDVVKIPAKVAYELRRERESKKVEGIVIAKRMGITPSYLYMLELGKRRFTHSLIHKYKAALASA